MVGEPGTNDKPTTDEPGTNDTPTTDQPGHNDTPTVDEPGTNDTSIVDEPCNNVLSSLPLKSDSIAEWRLSCFVVSGVALFCFFLYFFFFFCLGVTFNVQKKKEEKC
jgi:hypothetical protein